MPDTGSLMLSAVFIMLGVSIILFPGALRRTSEALSKSLVQLDVDLERNRPIRYLLALVAVALGWVLFRVALFFR